MFRVHLLDLGTLKYGDCLLVEAADKTILIDGGHMGDDEIVMRQLTELLGTQPPFHVNVLHISHAHRDHIGCLPSLIKDGHLTADIALLPDPDLAWPDSTIDLGGVEPDTPAHGAFRKVWAVLREQPLELDDYDDDQLAALMADAVKDEDRYRAMLERLTADETEVLLWPDEDSADRLDEVLDQVDVKILGPGREQAEACARFLQRSLADAVIDAPLIDPVALLRQVYTMDSGRRPGRYVNLQSVVIRLGVEGRKALFAGDCQFVEPSTSDQDIIAGLDGMREAIRDDAPYAFAKLSHHGSANAVDAEWLALLGATPLVGICTGAGHAAHPPAETLELLDNQSAIQWARTDRNGLVTIDLERDPPDGVTVQRSHLNDAEPNVEDVAGPVPEVVPPKPPVVRTAEESVEVVTRAPARPITVRVTLEVEPDRVAATPAGPRTTSSDRSARALGSSVLKPDQLRLGGGRQLPRLLFVTDRDALADAIGHVEADIAIDIIRSGGQRILIGPIGSPEDLAVAIRGHIDEETEGVVIVGGYNVVPAFRVDTMPAEAATLGVPRGFDLDRFIVWSDDPYVDLDGDRLPELPISRIPDALDPVLLVGALTRNRVQPIRAGLRNADRPFAEAVFDALPGTAPLRISHPVDVATFTPGIVGGSANYIMLHGSDLDATRFWGETENGQLLEAFGISDLPDKVAGTFLSGCCWGALIASSTAASWKPGQELSPRTAQQSIALSLLKRGAEAFVGTTGTHYSPPGDAPDRAGGPLHVGFWYLLTNRHRPPSPALFGAKQSYLAYVQGITDAAELAIASKLLTQFTCLGLGW